MQFNFPRFFLPKEIGLDQNQADKLASEKLAHILKAGKESIIPGFLAPLLCIPIFASSAGANRFYLWIGVAYLFLGIRVFLILAVNPNGDFQKGIHKLNWAIGISSAYWGLAWLLLIPTYSLEKYFLLYSITLIFIFINIYGNCINWSTLLSLTIPLHVFLVIFFITLPNPGADWPLEVGSALFFFYSLKMGLLFSKSWEKNLILRFKIEMLVSELTVEKDASTAANIAKSDFIATASHDLRQPMQSINIFLELINDVGIEEKEKQGILKKLTFSAKQLNKMFNTLLDISKLDAQSVLVKHEPFNIGALVRDIEGVLQPVAVAKNLELSFKGQNLNIIGDKSLLNQVLINLISNALQYTESGNVDVDFLEISKQLVIKVSDTGWGIPAEDLDLIYKEFYRVKQTRSMHDGLGLGLAIVSRVVRLIGAELSLKTEVGKGTSFKLTTRFPVLDSDGEQAHHFADEVTGGGGSRHFSSSSTPFLASKHLAIIEDDVILLDAYRSFFAASGYTVHIIPLSEAEFSAALGEIAHIDFILSDYRLGAGNGVSYIQKIREEFNMDIPAIIVTADTSPEHIKIFNDLNINILHKPIEPKEILAFIAKHNY
jgi:signal transduction histidine kinase/CheY-like chemotaxis protein